MVARLYLYDHWIPRYLTKWQVAQYSQMLNAELLTFRLISRHLSLLETCSYHHSIRLDEGILMVVRSCLYDHWIPRYSTKRQVAQYSQMLNAELLTFRLISRHLSLLEACSYHHSTRLNEGILMVVRPCSYNHWIPSYSAKCQVINIYWLKGF